MDYDEQMRPLVWLLICLVVWWIIGVVLSFIKF